MKFMSGCSPTTNQLYGGVACEIRVWVPSKAPNNPSCIKIYKWHGVIEVAPVVSKFRSSGMA